MAADTDAGQRYRPIRDYAAIGDCHGGALVSRLGSIDWCCLGRFDADPLFCRLLDADKGGFFSICPADDFEAERTYLGNTNILRTHFKSAQGEVTITDFMPVGRRPGAGVHDYVSLKAPFWLVRLVDGVRGEAPLNICYSPSVDFARRPPQLQAVDGAVVSSGAVLYGNASLEIDGAMARGRLRIGAGERRFFVVSPPSSNSVPSMEQLERLLGITRCFWEEWIAYCRYDGLYKASVIRSALVLKLMTYAPTGALVAALTASLPEEIGGTRNFDYRYCWLRDACLTLYALSALGYGGEARRFSRFLTSSCQSCSKMHGDLQIMYGVESEKDLTERTLEHLEGYLGSRPVRTGNGAYSQRQIDVYGEILDWALLFQRLGGHFDRRARELLEGLVGFVQTHWHEPDQGLWEMRGPPRHHLHGKLMCWVTLDRAISLLGHRSEWVELRNRIEADIVTRGIDQTGHYFSQAYDLSGADAAVLQLPMLGFPVEAELFENTITAIEDELRQGDFLRRYRTKDGFSGDEGAFLICSFWLVDALLCLGRYERARALFERLLKCANDVGLYSEEIDASDGQFLGNFPQAFTHLALINSAINLQLFEADGAEALRGSYADRSGRSVEATLGWRGLWAAFKRSRRVGKIFSSQRSILPP